MGRMKAKTEPAKVFVSLEKTQYGWCLVRRFKTGLLHGCSGRYPEPNHPELKLELRVIRDPRPHLVEYVFDESCSKIES